MEALYEAARAALARQHVEALYEAAMQVGAGAPGALGGPMASSSLAAWKRPHVPLRAAQRPGELELSVTGPTPRPPAVLRSPGWVRKAKARAPACCLELR